ncbi:type II CAAX endopeptidase family protein [Chitinophaga sp. 212800010-3]|uniref:CPBP family intramembrane glutamic endopeptidase n=1 Tax=unclassified Chitinophaga TaxID=2619133 RepID=UPI002DE8C38B|nr:CPBP family intramembrane metalloprotease [Chitinophaga sp. 212800010-3]
MTGYLKQSPVLMQFVTFLGFFFGFFAIYLFALGLITPGITGQSLEALQNGALVNPNFIGYLKITQFFYSIVAFFVPAALFAYLWQPYPMTYLGLKPAPKGIQVVLALVAIYGCLIIASPLGEWNKTWPVPDAVKDAAALAEKLLEVFLKMPTITDLLINLVLIAIVPAIAEEFFFRGVLQRLLIKATRNVWIGVFIASVIFSAIHGDILGFMPRLLLGIGLGAIYVFSGNLWLAIYAHILVNGMQVLMLYLFQHGMLKEDPAKDGTVEWYYVALAIPVTIGVFWALRKKSDPMPMIDPVEAATDKVDEIGNNDEI